ncbi:MAG TPA: hypothetical protein VNA15_01255 [Candidatus Angelobacter sp.]|nr:hypothetical protein [Candidatus Angelobacter sp.]
MSKRPLLLRSRTFFTSRASRLGLAGIGACALGLVMSVGALTGIYPRPGGSNLGNGESDVLFLAVFFTGELIGLLGLGILIYLGVSRRLRGRSSEDEPETRVSCLAQRVMVRSGSPMVSRNGGLCP